MILSFDDIFIGLSDFPTTLKISMNANLFVTRPLIMNLNKTKSKAVNSGNLYLINIF